jgi:hypothetical protein
MKTHRLLVERHAGTGTERRVMAASPSIGLTPAGARVAPFRLSRK